MLRRECVGLVTRLATQRHQSSRPRPRLANRFTTMPACRSWISAERIRIGPRTTTITPVIANAPRVGVNSVNRILGSLDRQTFDPQEAPATGGR